MRPTNNKSSKESISDEEQLYPKVSSVITQENPEVYYSPKQKVWFMRVVTGICSCFKISNTYSKATSDTLLPPQVSELEGRKTLVLDLDETLVHSSFKPVLNCDLTLEITFEGILSRVYVMKRPGISKFLKRMSELFEVVVFTASLGNYADPLLDLIDKERVIAHRLFRESCVLQNGCYVKDLSVLGRDLKNVIIVDNSPISYSLQPQNAVPITTWFDNKRDRELYKLVPILEELALVEDVTQVCSELSHKELVLSPENIRKVSKHKRTKSLSPIVEEERGYFNSPLNQNTPDKVFTFDNQ